MIVAIGVKNISRVGAVDDNGTLDDKMFLEKQEGPKKILPSLSIHTTKD